MLLHSYQSSWPKNFLQLKKIIEANFPSSEINIAHIGSTAVENLSAKPIIDMDITYELKSTFTLIKEGLENFGYYHNGNQGIEGREVFKRRLLSHAHPILDNIPHHLYVCHITNDEYNRHLIFRNFLRSNEEARMEYERLKIDIAIEAKQDKKKYALLKEERAKPFIEKMINEANMLKTETEKN